MESSDKKRKTPKPYNADWDSSEYVYAANATGIGWCCNRAFVFVCHYHNLCLVMIHPFSISKRLMRLLREVCKQGMVVVVVGEKPKYHLKK